MFHVPGSKSFGQNQHDFPSLIKFPLLSAFAMQFLHALQWISVQCISFVFSLFIHDHGIHYTYSMLLVNRADEEYIKDGFGCLVLCGNGTT